ncbi:unnamed protein product [Boreogadus saida]
MKSSSGGNVWGGGRISSGSGVRCKEKAELPSIALWLRPALQQYSPLADEPDITRNVKVAGPCCGSGSSLETRANSGSCAFWIGLSSELCSERTTEVATQRLDPQAT